MGTWWALFQAETTLLMNMEESVKQGIDWDGIDPLALISPFLLEECMS